MVRSSKRKRTPPFHGGNDRFESGADHHIGISPSGKAPVFEAGIAGSNPAIPAKYDAVPEPGLRGQSAKLLFAGSNPARISKYGAIV